MKIEHWERVIDEIATVDIHGDVDILEDQVIEMIDQHFATKYRACDYNILHFISAGIKSNRFYEKCY